MEIKNKDNFLIIESENKSNIFLEKEKKEVKIDDLNVSFPWEYEKSGILLEVKKYSWDLFYSFSVDWKHVLFVLNDEFELKEEILTFFWDVDLLVIIWTKKAVKIFENIEARIVVPYGEGKDIFLQSLAQNLEEQKSYKLKNLSQEETEFVNLAQ